MCSTKTLCLKKLNVQKQYEQKLYVQNFMRAFLIQNGGWSENNAGALETCRTMGEIQVREDRFGSFEEYNWHIVWNMEFV